MSKSRKSYFTAVSSIVYTFIYGFFGLIITRLVISNYGSDFNGINSTANQFIGMLLLLEGGFTIAINVALFRPVTKQDKVEINAIMSAARIIFYKIGLAVLIIGIIASIIYAFIIKSELSWEIAALTFSMTVISVSFNLIYSAKYTILLQTEQKEYIINSIKIVTTIISQLIIVIAIYTNRHMITVRFITMLGSVLNSIIIASVCRRSYSFLDFNVKPGYYLIKGVSDVFIQKITNMIYGSIPIVFISITSGTLVASVYAVYNSIFMLLKSVINAFVGAPRMGFGQLIAEKDNKYVGKIFCIYEFIITVVMFTIISTTVVLLMSFINLYAVDFTDMNYENWYLGLLLTFITIFEIIHIPSGSIINLAGHFKVGKNIQSIASLTLIILMIFGSKAMGFYGILLAVLLTAIVLAILEISYVHIKYFKGALSVFLRIFIPNLFFSAIFTLFEMTILPNIKNYFDFAIAGMILLIINTGLLLIFNYVINNKLWIESYSKFKFKSKRRKE